MCIYFLLPLLSIAYLTMMSLVQAIYYGCCFDRISVKMDFIYVESDSEQTVLLDPPEKMLPHPFN